MEMCTPYYFRERSLLDRVDSFERERAVPYRKDIKQVIFSDASLVNRREFGNSSDANYSAADRSCD